MSVKDFIGRKSAPQTQTITREQITEFCLAVGEEPSEVAPPTFMTAFRDPEFKLFAEMGIPLSKVLHGEQEYEYFAPLRAGMTLSFEAKLAQGSEKIGRTSSMKFLIFETDFKDAETLSPVGLSRTTIIVREKTGSAT